MLVCVLFFTCLGWGCGFALLVVAVVVVVEGLWLLPLLWLLWLVACCLSLAAGVWCFFVSLFVCLVGWLVGLVWFVGKLVGWLLWV